MTAEDEVHCLSVDASDEERRRQYESVNERLTLLISGERDLTAVLATIVCELHHAFEYYHWTGFYQVCRATKVSLVIGPYQGSHGCLRIPIGKGVCGMAAQDRKTQIVPNVHSYPGHIACAASTQSEVVVPFFSGGGELLGVLDVDSNYRSAFREVDSQELASIVEFLKDWNIFREKLT